MPAPAAAALVAALAACAGMDPQYRAARESWRGASFEQVLAAWGPPNRSLKSGSQEVHTWVAEDRVPRGGGSGVYGGVGVGRGGGHTGVGVGVGGVIFGGGPGEVTVRCERALIFRDARVIDEDWSGDAEFCKRFARR